jgi:hypothetical protein
MEGSYNFDSNMTPQGHIIRCAIMTQSQDGYRFTVERVFWEDDWDYDMDGNRFDDGNSGFVNEALFESLPFADVFEAEKALAEVFPFMALNHVIRPKRSIVEIRHYKEIM